MRETLKNAISQIKGNKLRTFLTMLGMLIGIGAVIIILSLGEGVKGFVNGQFGSVGKNVIQVQTIDMGIEQLIGEEDIETLLQISEVKGVYPTHMQYMGMGKNYKNETKPLMLFGIPHNFQEVQSLNLRYGRMFVEQDEDLKSNAIIVEDNFAEIIFNINDAKYALGKTFEITLGGEVQTFEIVGIAKSQYPSAAPKEMIAPIIYMPFSTADKYLNSSLNSSYSLMVTIKDEYEASDYSSTIKRLLEKKHGKEDIYIAMSVLEASNAFNSVLDTLNLFTAVVASISLLVGGIGIMNIMTVTVKERTREIGIRKALGATNKQILLQFLIEALILTLLGGISGLIVGYFGGVIIASAVGVNAQMTFTMIVFSVGTSSLIGLIFGVYPAYKAAQLDPVEALREE